MRKYTEVVILCEDRQQELFARYYLVRRGIDPRRIRVNIAQRGGGSGEQHVRENYPTEVRLFRARNYLNISLVVFVDADPANAVDFRLRQFDEALATAYMEKRRPEEKIGIFVPKRNIETWVHYLMGETVNERDSYPKLNRQSECKPYVARLAENHRTPLPESAPDSLKVAGGELHRIMPKND